LLLGSKLQRNLPSPHFFYFRRSPEPLFYAVTWPSGSLLTIDSELRFYTLPEFTPASKLYVRDANNFCEDFYREGTTEEDGSVLVTVLTRTTILRIKVKQEAKLMKVKVNTTSLLANCFRLFIIPMLLWFVNVVQLRVLPTPKSMTLWTWTRAKKYLFSR
jgi:hypothetical protein